MPSTPDIQQNLKEQSIAAIDRTDMSKYTGADKADREAAQKLKAKADTKVDRHRALENYAEQHFEPGRMVRFAEYSVSNTSPDASGKRTGTESVAYDKMLNTGIQLEKYLTTGDINEIKGNDAIKNAAKDAVVRVAESLPGADTIFSGMDFAKKRDYITGLMNDPEFRAIFKKIYSERTNPDLARQQLTDALQKRKGFEEKQSVQDQLVTKKTEFVTKDGQLRAELSKFNVVKDTSGRVVSRGEYAQQIQDVDTRIGTLLKPDTEAAYTAKHSTAVKAAETTLNAMQERLTRLPNTAKEAERTKATEDIKAAADALARAKEPLDTLDLLKKDKKTLEDKKDQLQADISSNKAQYDQVSVMLTQAQRETSFAKAEFDLVDPTKNIGPDNIAAAVAAEYFKEKMAHLDEAQRERDEKAIADAKEEATKRATEELARRWMKAETRTAVGKFLKGDRGSVVDDKAVDTDFAKILQPPPAGGPQALRTALGYDTTLTDQQWAEVQDFAVQKLLERKLQTGSIKEGEARLVFDSPWGGDILIKAMEHNSDFTKNYLGKLQEAGIVDGQDIGSIRKAIGKHPFLAGILMSLLLGVGAAAILPVAGVVAATASGASGAGLFAGGAGLAGTTGLGMLASEGK